MTTSLVLAISFALSFFFSDRMIEESPWLSKFLMVVGIVTFCLFAGLTIPSLINEFVSSSF